MIDALAALGRYWALLGTALVWGATNPFISRGARGIEGASRAGGLAGSLRFLATSWAYLLPLALNQGGSVLFYYALRVSSVSVAAPVANALTAVVTAATSYAIGEPVHVGPRFLLGYALVLGGVAVCISQ